MNNYITGTTRGLGKELLTRLQFYRKDFIGLNRPEYDLSEDLSKFVKTDFDFYILNAHHEYTQTQLLYKLFEANKDRECMIICIGSVSADGDRKEVNQYAIQKKALDAACTQLQLVKSKCTIVHIKLGRMDTDMVAHIDAPKMTTRDVSEVVNFMINLTQNRLHVKTVTFDIKEKT